MTTSPREAPGLSPLKQALVAIERLKSEVGRLEAARREPLAIVGIGCRFPGGANDPSSFWAMLRAGVNVRREVPADRWAVDEYFDPDPDAPGTMTTRYGGFLDDVRGFDASFFGISSREASTLDPQQRLLLEVAWEALEDAGAPPTKLRGKKAGVFVGIMSNDYSKLFVGHPDYSAVDPYYCTGNSFSFAPGRLSYFLGLHGPSIAVDTACSSSLVAVHEACRSLRAGDCDLALAGGVSLILSPELSIYLSKARVIAEDGLCKTFDASADGIGRGEGCGIVVLKRLSDALAAGDRIYCVVRGSAVNHDGASGGLTVPSGKAQEALVRAALSDARLDPEDVDYVEAHGTGTPLGDPIEVHALSAVFNQGRPPRRPLALGSVKTNLGHLDAAAGVAGLIKTALAIKHAEVPPHLHFREPSPHIAWPKGGLVVPIEPSPWPSREGRRRGAGVSAFGLSGINAHVVLEQAPDAAAPQDTAPRRGAAVLPLSARGAPALKELARRYADALAARPDADIDALCWNAGARRSHHGHRLALVAEGREQACRALSAFANEESTSIVHYGEIMPGERPRAVFLFSGQGSQWAGMAARLLDDEPAFRGAVARCDEALRAHAGLSIADELRAEGERSRLHRTDVAQLAIFAVQVGLVALLRSWGVEPSAVVGHSVGEVAAAHVAGALTLEDAVAVVYHRGRLMQRTEGEGRMALVELSASDAALALAPFEPRLSIAAVNGPESAVVAGEPEALEALLARLASAGVMTRPLRVNYAFHSPQMRPLGPELEAALSSIRPAEGRLRFFSTVTGAALAGGALDAGYWARNMCEPVMFASAVDAALDGPPSTFVEVGPHAVLALDVERAVARRGASSAVVPTMRREKQERGTLLEAAARLYAAGFDLDFTAAAGGASGFMPLPSYPWQREPFWFSREVTRAVPRGHDKPFALDAGLERADSPGHLAWGVRLDDAAEWLRDHAVAGAAILPGSAYVQLFASAAQRAFRGAPHRLEGVRFLRALSLGESPLPELQVVLSPLEAGAFKLFAFARAKANEGDAGPPWACHAVALARASAEQAPPAHDGNVEAALARCPRPVGAGEHYEGMAALGMNYGPSFRCVEAAFRGDGEAIVDVRLGPSLRPEAPSHLAHPALLDGCFQALALAAAGEAGGGAFVPVEIEHLRINAPLGERVRCHARMAPAEGGALAGDLFVYDEGGRPLLEARRFSLARLESPAEAPLDDALLQALWQKAPRPAPRAKAAGTWLVLDLRGDLGASIARELRRRGHRCVLAGEGASYTLDGGRATLDGPSAGHCERLVADVFGRNEAGDAGGVIFVEAYSLSPEQGSLARAAAAQHMRAAALVAALAKLATNAPPRLWLVTRNAQAVAPGEDLDVTQAPLWGAGVVMPHEHPSLRATRVDLSPEAGAPDVQALADEIEADCAEDQIAFRGGERFVRRVVRSESPVEGAPAALLPAPNRPHRLEVGRPGLLDSMAFVRAERRAPRPGEVEIEVRTTALNFIDVLKAMGLYPGREPTASLLGGECSGVVTRVGEGVSRLAPGDEVVAIAFGSFGSHVVTDARLAARKPQGLSFEGAASMPVAYMTAWHGLVDRARLRAGETVLVHSAAGGTGLAAVRIAQRLGARVLATAGSPEKRAWLREHAEIEHVFDSRTLAFADDAVAATAGRGVDVVFNSLSGEAIPAGFAALAPFGRFVEIGKRDLYDDAPIGLGHFRRNVSYHVVDLVGMAEHRPDECQELLAEVLTHYEKGALSPLPAAAFEGENVALAFEHMARARHIGKIVVNAVAEGAPALAPSRKRARDGATYLITGGLGGLGLAVAGWLSNEGARHVVLVGRKAPAGGAYAAVERLRAKGVEVRVEHVDVAHGPSLAALFTDLAETMPPLRGVVHAAGVVDDGPLIDADEGRVKSVLAPKIDGAWHLHKLTEREDLDFFVCFSSTSSLLGSPGQAAYAAGNAFLDGLAHHRRARNLPALTVGWGAWAGVGMAASLIREGGRLATRGYLPILPARGVEALGRLLSAPRAYAAVVPLDLVRWREAHPSVGPLPFLSGLEGAEAGPADAAAPAAHPFARELGEADEKERGRMLETYLRQKVAEVLRTDAERVNLKMPFDAVGLDSLMAVELKNRLEVGLGLALSPTLVWAYPTIVALARHLLSRLSPDGGGAAPKPAEAAPAISTDEATALAEALAGLAALPGQDLSAGGAPSAEVPS